MLRPTVWKGVVQGLKRQEQYHLIFILNCSFYCMIDPAAVKTGLKILYGPPSDGDIFFKAETDKAALPLDVWHNSVWHKPNGQMIMCALSLR